jgi:hypothetical protein
MTRRENARAVRVLTADTPELLDAVYAFRYRVYVELMGRRQKHADHVRKRIAEPLDSAGVNFVAMRGGTVVGVVRGNAMDDDAATYYRRLYKFSLFDVPAADVMFSTKLMIDPALRGSPIVIELIRAYARHGYRRGVRVNVIDCNKPLIPFFEKIGYFSYTGWVFHREYGTVRPMFLATDALRYFESIDSVVNGTQENHLVDGAFGGYDLIERIAKRPESETVREKAASHFSFRAKSSSSRRALGIPNGCPI